MQSQEEQRHPFLPVCGVFLCPNSVLCSATHSYQCVVYFRVQTVQCYPFLPVCGVFSCPNSVVLPIPTSVWCIFMSKQCSATQSYQCVQRCCVQTVQCYPFLPVCSVFLCLNNGYSLLPVCGVFLCPNSAVCATHSYLCVVYFCV